LNIAVIGAGAIGGYYGARLFHAGHRVHFLLRSDYDCVKKNGLKVASILGDFSVDAPLAYCNIKDMPPCDIVCVTVKTTANEEIFPLLACIVKAGTVILLMQNGFSYEYMLARLYPQCHIIAGLCFICAFREGPAYVRHSAYGKISLAALNKNGEQRLREIVSIFANAAMEYEIIPDLAEARWRKLVWNIPYNGLCAIMNCPTDKLTASPSMRQAIRAIMEEVIAAANACNTGIDYSFADEMEKMTDAMPSYSPSMRLDFLAGRPLETEGIYGKPILCAEKYGFDMKYTKMLKWQLEHMQLRGISHV
jgi:2-dehydropantoate 2-reductase